MPKRGSVQLLLLSFHSRTRLGSGVLAGVIIVVLAFSFQAGSDFPLLTRTGLTQVIHQSAWEHALAGLPDEAWPWEEVSQAAGPKVARLGLSAAVLSDKDGSSTLAPLKAGRTDRARRSKLGDITVGDRITVTAADGSSRIYKVTGRRVVDPHLGDTEPKPSDADIALVTCSPPDPLLASSPRLVIQAIKVDPPAPPKASAEQKL